MKVYTRGNGEPEVTVVGSLHGDEPAGKKAIQKILDEEIEYRKTVKFIVANEKALGKNQRYIDADLNRAFPGNPESELHEERLAAEILNEIKGVTLDIHTTRSYSKPFAVLKNIDEETLELVRASGADKAVYFPNSSGALMEHESSIVVETGLQGSDRAVENAVETIKNFLGYYDAINYSNNTSDPEIYKYTETVEGNWEFKARNFEKVGKNEIYAVRDGEELKAEKEFYPVLMSTNGYKGQLGYKAEKMSL